MDELSLDHCFWREISTSSEFQNWLIAKTKFRGRSVELLTEEKTWHQRWYKDPDTKNESETDILLIFSDLENKNRYALHIENKPAHGKWRPGQAEKYRKRALDLMKRWHYDAFETVLLAPGHFIERHPIEAAHFDFLLPYEEVAAFVSEFEATAAKQPSLHPTEL